MNGIIAGLTLTLPCRLLRVIVFLVCCVLSVSLIGAVHTRTRDADRIAAAPGVEPEGAVELASYQPPTLHTLLPAAPPARSADVADLLHDARPAAPPTALPYESAVKSVAALFTSQVEKVLSFPAAPAARGRVVWMEVTAYCPCKKCCGPRAQGVTASGRPVSHNGGRFVAADTRVLAFNTRVFVPGYADGAAVPVIDRGGAI